MNWIVFFLVIYLLGLIYMSIKDMKKTSLEKYLINNRNTKLIPLLFSSLATFVGGGVSIGLITMGYQGGFAVIAVGISYVLGFILFSFFAKNVNKIGREDGIYSFVGYLNKRFESSNNNFNRLFSSVVNFTNIFIVFFLLAVQFVGIASMLEYFLEIDYKIAVVVAAFVVIFYTTVAGLSGVIITDFIQFILLIIVIIVIFIPGVLNDTQLFSNLNSLPSSFLNGTAFGKVFLFGLPLFFMPTVFVQISIWQRVLAAKNGKIAKKTMLYSGLGMLPFYLVFPLVGMSVLLTNGNISNDNHSTFIFLTNHSNNFMLGFALIGLLSALMSSGDSFLNIISISTVKDFKGWLPKTMNSKKEFLILRITTLIYGFLALFLAINYSDIVDLFVIGSSAIVVFVPCTFHSFIIKNVSKYRWSAIISIILGCFINIFVFVYSTNNPDIFEPKASFVLAFIFALLTYLVGNLIISIREK